MIGDSVEDGHNYANHDDADDADVDVAEGADDVRVVARHVNKLCVRTTRLICCLYGGCLCWTAQLSLSTHKATDNLCKTMQDSWHIVLAFETAPERGKAGRTFGS